MTFPLMSVSIIFGLSLIGSIVLFKFLKSSATITKPTYRAGGAVAGFILIYGLLFTSFKTLYKPSETWTIMGSVIKEGSSLHDGIDVKQVPPSPWTTTDTGGGFMLENIKVNPDEGLPELYFECEGFHPQFLSINDDIIKSKDKGKKKILLKDKVIELAKIAE